MPYLPPDVANAVIAVSIRVQIDAPASTVWEVILDFPSYPLWNSFIRAQAITDNSFKPLLAHSRPKEGDHLLMHVRVPPVGLHDNDRGLRASKGIIAYVDEEYHRVCWKQVGIPCWMLRAQRLQEVLEEHVGGRTVTIYTTTETFNGPFAWLIRWFLSKNLRRSFQVMAEGLKTRSEELAANARSA